MLDLYLKSPFLRGAVICSSGFSPLQQCFSSSILIVISGKVSFSYAALLK